MTTNKQLVKIALNHLGEGGAKFRKFAGLPSGAAWCNAFVDYIAYQGDVEHLYFNGVKETYCPHSIKWCEKNLAQIPPYLAMAGDIIYFDWEKNGVPNHIGLVRDKVSTSTIATVEGNTNGSVVAKKNRSTGYVQAIFRPHFNATGLKLGRIEVDGDFGYSSIGNLQRALGVQVDGILGKGTVKALQTRAGVKADGHWGKGTSKAVQKMVGATVDGEFGVKSVKCLQKWVNKQNVHETPETPSKPKLEPYKGTLPKLPPKTAKIAMKCAYPYGTPSRKYKYKGGKPKPEYKEELNKAYPHRKHWKYAKSRAGASCDVFAGTVLKRSGYKKAPHAMSKMVAFCKRSLKPVSCPQNGDILTRTNHVMVFLELRGKKRVANAHFLDHGGTYGIIERVGQHTDIWRPDCPSYFSYGDEFTDMKYLKRFLNWYGNYNLKGYTFGEKCLNAVKDFQTKEGLTVDGKFGSESLARAKAVTK